MIFVVYLILFVRACSLSSVSTTNQPHHHVHHTLLLYDRRGWILAVGSTARTCAPPCVCLALSCVIQCGRASLVGEIIYRVELPDMEQITLIYLENNDGDDCKCVFAKKGGAAIPMTYRGHKRPKR